MSVLLYADLLDLKKFKLVFLNSGNYQSIL
jgi:hypothetical protein